MDYQGNCLGGIEYSAHGRRVEVSPRAGCSWQRLIDLDIFNGFRPGMSIQEAREIFGEPFVETTSGDNRFWRYQREMGIVQIGREDQGASIFPMYYWWVLRAYPNDTSPSAIFPPEVASAVLDGKAHEVVILNQCRLPMAEVIIENNRVRLMTWIDNPGSFTE